jgi:hypothetical protein
VTLEKAGLYLALNGWMDQARRPEMDGTILKETLQAILPESVIEQYAEKLGVVEHERSRKRDIVKLVYSLVLFAGSDDSGVLADAMKRCNTEVEAKKRVVRGGFYAWRDDEMADLIECMVETAMNYAASLPPFLPGILGRGGRLVDLRFRDDHPAGCARGCIPRQRQRSSSQGA